MTHGPQLAHLHYGSSSTADQTRHVWTGVPLRAFHDWSHSVDVDFEAAS